MSFFTRKLLTKGMISEKQFVELETVDGNELDYLYEQNIIGKDDLIKEIEEIYHISYVNLDKTSIQYDSFSLLDENVMKKYNILVFASDSETVSIATAKPYDYVMDEDLNILLKPKRVKKYFAFKREIDRKRSQLSEQGAMLENGSKDKARDEAVPGEKRDNAVQIVERLLKNAFEKKISDIHLEPLEDFVRVRYRLDGELYITNDHIKIEEYPNIVSRIKVMADMDPSEKRKPQDGRISKYKVNQEECNMRVSTLNTVYGEKIVIRILENKSENHNLGALGFFPEQVKTIEQLISKSNGILLVTGETGSGKTTTLYTILNQLNQNNVNICTIEDPVESVIPGINQVQVNELAGITFANTLKTFLRQDPNIIMVGEIRDMETAEIAIKASNTGHYVLSTIHTNNATSTINRLVSMGVEPYKISENIKGVISQKLVKKICPHCKQKHTVTTEEMNFIRQIERKYNLTIWREGLEFYEGTGCSKCRNGQLGRTVVAEILEVNDDINLLITPNMNNVEFRQKIVQMKEARFTPIEMAGIQKALEGTVSLREIMKTFR